MVLNEKNSRKLLESGLDSIEVSLDRESEMDSQNNRRKSKTDLIIKNLKFLIDLKKQLKLASPKIYISSTQFLKKMMKIRQISYHLFLYG